MTNTEEQPTQVLMERRTLKTHLIIQFNISQTLQLKKISSKIFRYKNTKTIPLAYPLGTQQRTVSNFEFHKGYVNGSY